MQSLLPKIRHLLAGVLFCALLVAAPAAGAPVSPELAEQVGQNLLAHLGAPHSVTTVETAVLDGNPVGYTLHLHPRGYILVAGDDIRVPVKGYSLSSFFVDLPPEYRDNLLRELEIPDDNLAGALSKLPGGEAEEEINAEYWQYLRARPKLLGDQPTLDSYTPDTHLLSTRWNQGFPYNKFNPQVNGTLTLTGCTQTAIAQMMGYHSHPSSGSGVFTHSWNGQTLTAVMNRPFNWTVMPYVVSGSVPEYQQDEVAALMRDLGILNRANFGTSGTSASFDSARFSRAFGYAPVSIMPISNSAFFPTLIAEIDSLRPVILRMPNHLTVADGYASDGTGRKIHVNLGWGGAHDDYYYLDQTNLIGQYSFAPNHTIYYNIQPCSDGNCNPYPPLSTGQGPVINSALSDMIIAGETTLRIEANDPDGDSVTLTILSSCDGVQATMQGNLLTLAPDGEENFCEVVVKADSADGETSRTWQVLTLHDHIFLGTQYTIGGIFADRATVYEHTAYLEGEVTISGSRGYSNQAFYIWVKNEAGSTVIAPSNTPVSGTLPAGFYTIAASLTSPMGSYYNYNEDFSGYTLNVVAPDSTYTVADLAADRGVSLAPLYQCGKRGDVNGDSTVGLADAIIALQAVSGGAIPPETCTAASLDGSGRVGLAEAVFALQRASTID